MRFGPVPVAEGLGAVLAHTIRLPDGVVLKGTVLEPRHLELLDDAGVAHVVVGRLGPGDVGEDEAAARVAGAAAGRGVEVSAAGAGRVNLRAAWPGLLVVDGERVGRALAAHEGVGLSTLAPYSVVGEGTLVASSKIVPLAVPDEALTVACARLADPEPVLRVEPFGRADLVMITTTLPGDDSRRADRAVDVTRRRVEALGSRVSVVWNVPHAVAELTEAIGRAASGQDPGPTLVLGASATVDRSDVVPSAILAAGGTVDRLGIPIDPGNLLLLGRVGEHRIIGMPGCARSPRRSGFDTVLERCLAGLVPGEPDWRSWGVGGLLKEIPTRPRPRAETPSSLPSPRAVGAIVLAAGLSRRMGERNKLVVEVGGVPMVAAVVDRLERAGIAPITVVTGHDEAAVREALRSRDVGFVHNPDYSVGLASSLRVGVTAQREDVGSVLVCLGDMPTILADTYRRLAAAAGRLDPAVAAVPLYGGKRGNPVLWSREAFEELREIEGDVGARGLLAEMADRVLEVPIDDPGILVDVDTSSALRRIRDDGGTQE